MIVISFALLLSADLPGFAQQDHVQELQKESRLPAWANYVCYNDARNIRSGWFMLIGYQPAQRDAFFPNDPKGAKDFGYSRGLTYQEYIASDTGISPINMPISPEDYAEEMPKAMQGQPVSAKTIEMAHGEVVAMDDAIAYAKSTRQAVAEYPALEAKFLKDAEAQALLDAPDGTNFRNFLEGHPGFATQVFYRQKYIDAGMTAPDGGFKVYREGNVAFERDFGSGIFGPAGSLRSTDEQTKGLATRIQLEDTASGLRFLQSNTIDGSGIGIPITGRCDHISNR
jgi:hypothetical protein